MNNPVFNILAGLTPREALQSAVAMGVLFGVIALVRGLWDWLNEPEE